MIDLRMILQWDREALLTSVAKTVCCPLAHEALTQFGNGAGIAGNRGPVRRNPTSQRKFAALGGSDQH
ncbi:hypothetical protein ACFO0A_06545 [Novosphingobium tardum]|uniref:Uncharacterized protein n=1 Tax=Novosphingobium tardum TaxID=1538021 RepID=A0ABV8RN62_9SPHN